MQGHIVLIVKRFYKSYCYRGWLKKAKVGYEGLHVEKSHKLSRMVRESIMY